MVSSTVMQGFTTGGVIDDTKPPVDFQTFTFSPAWSGLNHVGAPGFGWLMGNVRVSVPEPTAGC
jgi:hypothetical protein